MFGVCDTSEQGSHANELVKLLEGDKTAAVDRPGKAGSITDAADKGAQRGHGQAHSVIGVIDGDVDDTDFAVTDRIGDSFGECVDE